MHARACQIRRGLVGFLTAEKTSLLSGMQKRYKNEGKINEGVWQTPKKQEQFIHAPKACIDHRSAYGTGRFDRLVGMRNKAAGYGHTSQNPRQLPGKRQVVSPDNRF